MKPRRSALLACTLALLGLAGPAARAHDTWFEALPTARPGELRLALGTGNRFPVQESSPGAASLVALSCRDAQGRARPLRPQRDGAQTLPLRARVPAVLPVSCWAQQAPQHVTLAPDKVALYLNEVRAPQAVRERWAALAARGQPWVERYTKHARFDRGDAQAQALPLGLDIVREGPLPRAGDTLAFSVLRDGRPLPHFAVELVNARSGLGLWLMTDGEGRASLRVPLAGDWLLRGVDLRPHPDQPDAWDSRFVTLAFNVGEAAAVSPF